MSVLQSAAHEDIRPPALITGPACREIVPVHSGAVHVIRTRGCVCENEIVYEYVNENENDYAVMQIKPEPALRAPGLTAVCGEAAAVCGETRPTLPNWIFI